jgi:hypothetical protein
VILRLSASGRPKLFQPQMEVRIGRLPLVRFAGENLATSRSIIVREISSFFSASSSQGRFKGLCAILRCFHSSRYHPEITTLPIVRPLSLFAWAARMFEALLGDNVSVSIVQWCRHPPVPQSCPGFCPVRPCRLSGTLRASSRSFCSRFRLIGKLRHQYRPGRD